MFGGLRYLQTSRVALMTIGCLCFVAGIGLAAVWQIATPLLLGSLGLLVLCRSRRVLFALPIVICVGLGLGLWRGSMVQQTLAQYNQFVGRKVVV